MTTGANSPLAELPFETGATGGSKGGRTKAASQAFLQAFPNLACFCPSFSKQIFGRFVGFQGVASLKNLSDVSPNFGGSRLPSAVFQPPLRRIPPPRAGCVRAHSALRVGLRCSLVEGAFMAGSI